jgi:hypothetical protein
MKCKFCGCTDEKACGIPMVIVRESPRLALPAELAEFVEPCGWIAENICSAPACVNQAYTEAELLASQIQFLREREIA